MSYFFGKLWHSAIIWPIRKSFQCTLKGVRFLLAIQTRLSGTSDNESYMNSSNPFIPPLKVHSMLSLNSNSAQASHGKPLHFHPNKLSKQHGRLKDLTLCSTVKYTLDVLLIAGRGSLLSVWTLSQHRSGPVPRVLLPTS